MSQWQNKKKSCSPLLVVYDRGHGSVSLAELEIIMLLIRTLVSPLNPINRLLIGLNLVRTSLTNKFKHWRWFLHHIIS